MSYLEVKLATIADGKAIAQFDFELKRALENCLDIATPATGVREVTLKVKIKPNEDRQRAEVTYQATAKLCPDAAGTDLVIFGQKGKHYVSSARQLNLDEQGEHNVEELGAGTAEPNGGAE